MKRFAAFAGAAKPAKLTRRQKPDKTIDAKGVMFFLAESMRILTSIFLSWGLFRAMISKRERWRGFTVGRPRSSISRFNLTGALSRDGLEAWHEKARGKAVGDYAFHMAVTDFNETTGRKFAISWKKRE